MTACPAPSAVALFWGLLLACACLWLLALALLTAAALRDGWRAWFAEPDDGGPEVDRLIAESMAAWRADCARRILGRLRSRGLLIDTRDGWVSNAPILDAGDIILEELERTDHAD